MADSEHLRLRLPPGIRHALRKFAQSRGWTMSATATRLIAERLDHYSVVEQRQEKVLNEILAILKGEQQQAELAK
jgi:hypothetical protein